MAIYGTKRGYTTPRDKREIHAEGVRYGTSLCGRVGVNIKTVFDDQVTCKHCLAKKAGSSK